ncbi:hypothetical protein EV360DRAFT_89072 [Lentinula raphanica]|nr:hypothetical protein EV360DRAFT_89072 [Lentinula raphanica]
MNLTNQVRSIAQVTKAVASGDLPKKIQVDVKGEILDLNSGPGLRSQQCQAIVEQSKDNRFAKLNWDDVARDRVYRILLEISHSLPKPGETKKEVLARVLEKYVASLENAKNTSSRHRKYDLRMKVASAMVEVCEDRQDRDGHKFWQWVVFLLERAGHEFMSDEEDMWFWDTGSGTGSSSIPKAAK